MSITLCLLLFYIVILCCAFLTWCDVDVLLVGSGWLVPCVFCADVSVHYYFVCWICVGVSP